MKKPGRLQHLLLVILCIFLAITHAYAAPRKVKAGQLKATSIIYKKKKVAFYCLARTAGTVKKVGSSVYFTTYSEQIRKLTSRRDKAKKESLTAINKLATAKCKVLALPTPTPTPTATPSPTPTATATPQATFAAGNFDGNGNVTATGKSVFQIPANLSGNISLGRDVYDTYCFGCHVERVNRTFPDLRYNTSRPPMNYDSTDLPDAELANLVAYLNRFRF